MQNKYSNFVNIYCVEIIWVVIIGFFGRLIPHIPNFTPIVGLSLFVGANLPRSLSFLLIAFTLFISDLCLALIFGYPVVGYFTLFTYTGFMAIVLISSKIRVFGARFFPFYVLCSSCGFWIWTNFGFWLTGNLYAKTFSGLLMCYYVALSFLRNSMIGDLIWSSLIFGVFYLWLKKKPENQQRYFKKCDGRVAHFET